jgi:hypothetical protein
MKVALDDVYSKYARNVVEVCHQECDRTGVLGAASGETETQGYCDWRV